MRLFHLFFKNKDGIGTALINEASTCPLIVTVSKDTGIGACFPAVPISLFSLYKKPLTESCCMKCLYSLHKHTPMFTVARMWVFILSHHVFAPVVCRTQKAFFQHDTCLWELTVFPFIILFLLVSKMFSLCQLN